MTRQTSGAASSAPPGIFAPVVQGLEIVPTIYIDLGRGGKLVWLQHFYDGEPLVQSRSSAEYVHGVDFLYIIFDNFNTKIYLANFLQI